MFIFQLSSYLIMILISYRHILLLQVGPTFFQQCSLSTNKEIVLTGISYQVDIGSEWIQHDTIYILLRVGWFLSPVKLEVVVLGKVILKKNDMGWSQNTIIVFIHHQNVFNEQQCCLRIRTYLHIQSSIEVTFHFLFALQ